MFTPLEYGCCGLSEEAAIEVYKNENLEVRLCFVVAFLRVTLLINYFSLQSLLTVLQIRTLFYFKNYILVLRELEISLNCLSSKLIIKLELGQRQVVVCKLEP